MRDLLARETQDVRAAEAVVLSCCPVNKWIGVFEAELDGLDTLEFAGGIGENAPTVRARIYDGLGFLGIELEEKRMGEMGRVYATTRILRRTNHAHHLWKVCGRSGSRGVARFTNGRGSGVYPARLAQVSTCLQLDGSRRPPVPAPFQALAALSEFGGGFALILGLLTPVAAFGIACTMTVALVMVHLPHGDPFVGSRGGPSFEPALGYLSIMILLILNGPGVLSLDALLFGRNRFPVGTGALSDTGEAR